MRIVRTFDRTSMQDDTSEPTREPRGPGTAGEPARDVTQGSRTGGVADTLGALPIDVDLIADPIVKHAMQVLLNMVERLGARMRRCAKRSSGCATRTTGSRASRASLT